MKNRSMKCYVMLYEQQILVFSALKSKLICINALSCNPVKQNINNRSCKTDATTVQQAVESSQFK